MIMGRPRRAHPGSGPPGPGCDGAARRPSAGTPRGLPKGPGGRQPPPPGAGGSATRRRWPGHADSKARPGQASRGGQAVANQPPARAGGPPRGFKGPPGQGQQKGPGVRESAHGRRWRSATRRSTAGISKGPPPQGQPKIPNHRHRAYLPAPPAWIQGSAASRVPPPQPSRVRRARKMREGPPAPQLQPAAEGTAGGSATAPAAAETAGSATAAGSEGSPPGPPPGRPEWGGPRGAPPGRHLRRKGSSAAKARGPPGLPKCAVVGGKQPCAP